MLPGVVRDRLGAQPVAQEGAAPAIGVVRRLHPVELGQGGAGDGDALGTTVGRVVGDPVVVVAHAERGGEIRIECGDAVEMTVGEFADGPHHQLFLDAMRACIRARRSWNHGCSRLQIWGSISRSTASSWVDTSAMSLMVCFVFTISSRGASAALAAMACAAGDQLTVGHAAVHEADALGLGAVRHVTEEHHRRRRLGSDRSTHHPGVAAAGVEPQRHEARVEARRFGGEADVASERHVHPGADGGPVHRRDASGSGLRATRRNPS